MATLEQVTRVKRHRAQVQDGLVLALYAATAFTIALTAPNALRLLRGIDPNLGKKRKPNYRLQQALKRLEERGLVTRSGRGFSLTKKGQSHAQQLHAAAQIHIRVPNRWDGRWRIIIFDVWERRREVRDKLRALLKKAGFLRLQNSVWVHPYDCEEFISFMRTELRLGGGLLYIIAEGIENDLVLKKHFAL